MSHKINELNGPGHTASTSVGGSRSAGATAASSGSAPAGAEPVASAAEVHITDTANRLAALEPALREAPAVDSARVAAIRSAIDQGGYTIRPEHIATQLVQVEQALGQLHGRPIAETQAAGSLAKP